MTKDYPQLWKNVTSSRDEDKAVRILAEILVDREGRSFVGTLKRADAELCVEILDHVSLSLIRQIRSLLPDSDCLFIRASQSIISKPRRNGLSSSR